MGRRIFGAVLGGLVVLGLAVWRLRVFRVFRLSGRALGLGVLRLAGRRSGMFGLAA
jgi:hypothetical protein